MDVSLMAESTARGRGGRGRKQVRPGTGSTPNLVAALLTTVLLLVPAGTSAQSLEEVDSLIRDGFMQEARETLLRWEASNPRPGREDAQRNLWFRAILTLDPEQAESTLRRLVLEYPGGTFTPGALQRLGQGAALRGDLAAARGHYDVLIRDYPNSPGRVEAQNWMARNREALAALDASSGARPDTDSTPQRQPARVDPVPPRSDRVPAPPVVPPQGQDRGKTDMGLPPDDAQGDYSVQLGAFGALEGARRLSQQVRDAGFEVRIVQLPGSAFYRVRVGRYATPERARTAVDRLRAAGFDAGLGTRGSEERPAGGA